MKSIILITGPIASGKSHIAKALSIELNEEGIKSTYLDIDKDVNAIDPRDKYKSDLERKDTWTQARIIIIKKASRLLEDGMEVVIISGPFFYKDTIDEITHLINNCYSLSIYSLKTNLCRRLVRNAHREVSNNPIEIIQQFIKLLKRPVDPIAIEIDNDRSIELTIKEIANYYKAQKGQAYL